MIGATRPLRVASRTRFPDRALLCGVPNDVDLTFGGARRESVGWSVSPSVGYDADLLDRWLPRRLRADRGTHASGGSAGHASDLSSSLCRTSWRILSDVACAMSVGCHECGGPAALGASPVWSWSAGAAVSHGVLEGVHGLCRDCSPCVQPHATTWRWPADRRIARIAHIYGMQGDEARAMLGRSRDVRDARERLGCSIDISIIAGKSMRFGRSWRAEGNLVSGPDGRAAVSIVGADLASTPRGVSIGA